MALRSASLTVSVALLALCAVARHSVAQAGSCCLPNGNCIIASSLTVCTNSTNKGVFVGNPACTAGLLGDCWPDIHVVSLPDSRQWGRLEVTPGKWIHSFSFGTYSCNQGTTNAKWISTTNQHPVISQDVFRLNNGRLEHIGMAWVKHGFFALSNVVAACGPCTWNTDGTSLGVGCADPYSASGENGTQSRLGPRSLINPTNGAYVYPATWPPITPPGSVIARRLQIDEADLNNVGATYWLQGQYVTADDAQAGKGLNNASYRRVTFGAATTFTPTLQDSTVTKTPVIFAWQANGLGIGVPDPNVVINLVDVPGDGRYYVGSKATDLGGGMWHYEYAVQNINSDRAGGGFSVPIGPGVTVSNLGFHAPFYHSGELSDPAAWVPTVDSASVRWDPAALPNPNPQGLVTNALRWSTLYNFRFDANVAPATGQGQVTLPLFVAGSPSSVTVGAVVPSIPVAVPGACCLNDGTCSVLASADCQTALGDYKGDGIQCTPGLCPIACCFTDGTCSELDLDACSTASGTPHLPDKLCIPNPCPQPPGACCATDGTCTLTAAIDCPLGSVFLGSNTACTTSACAGACCTGGLACTMVDTAALCSGYWGGATVLCNAPGNRTQPCCQADYNGANGVTVQDLFDFLAAYFVQSLSADFNQSGTTTVQDLFTFLAAWFAKC